MDIQLPTSGEEIGILVAHAMARLHLFSKGHSFDHYPQKMKIVQEVIREMQFPVILLNVTKLTNFRKDGHPSVFGKKQAPGERVSSRKQDCSHWCLPGVPDAWNELVYANLVLQNTLTSKEL